MKFKTTEANFTEDHDFRSPRWAQARQFAESSGDFLMSEIQRIEKLPDDEQPIALAIIYADQAPKIWPKLEILLLREEVARREQGGNVTYIDNSRKIVNVTARDLTNVNVGIDQQVGAVPED